MAINDNALIKATVGTIFYAPADTPLPTGGAKVFATDKDTIPSSTSNITWKNIGHLSDSNRPSFSIDGGDAKSEATWLKTNARTSYEPVKGTVTINSVQSDKETMQLFYNGVLMDDGGLAIGLSKRERKLALFILYEDTNNGARAGVYLPNTSFAFDKMPDFSGDFVEYSGVATIMDSKVLPKSDTSGSSIAFYTSDQMSNEPTAIAASPATVTVKAGAEASVNVTLTPVSATTSLSVLSNDQATATATVRGTTITVHGVKQGTTSLNITSSGGKSATVSVNVTASA